MWCLSERIHFPVVKLNKVLSSGNGVYPQMSRIVLNLIWHPSEVALQYSLEQNDAVLTSCNRMVYLYTKKVRKEPKSVYGMCPGQLLRVHAEGPKVLMRLSKKKNRVRSASAKCVSDWIKCAFLSEEQKNIVNVLKTQAQNQKANFLF